MLASLVLNEMMMWTLFLAVTWILTVVDAASHQGTDYALGFYKNARPAHQSPADAVLYISTQEPRGANVTVEIPNAATEFRSEGFPLNFKIAQFETRVVQFPANAHLDIQIIDDGRGDRGIHIFSDNEAKLDIVGLNAQETYADAFLALPCMLENEPEVNFFTSTYQYFIFTAFSADDTSSYFLIIPCTPGGPSGNTGIKYTIPGRDEETLGSLYQYETFLVSSATDLTGTIITAPWPLAVFAGHQCGEIPQGVFPCDHLVEQIPPDITYGTKFFVLPFAVRESGDILRIGSTVLDNEVSITCTRREADNSIHNMSFTETINTGEFVEYRTRDRNQEPGLSSADYRRDYCSIETSKPAIVMQYMLASGEDDVEFEGVRPVGDPAMTLIPPVQQYSNEYTIVTPNDYTQYHYIGWAIAAEFFNPQIDFVNFLVDNAVFLPTPDGSSEYIPIYCRDGEVCGYGGVGQVERDVRQVSYRPPSQEDASMYVSVYGFDREVSYAYPAGMRCDPIGLPHISAYDVFVIEGIDAAAEVKFNRTGGNLAIRSRALASTRQIADSNGRAVADSDFQSVPLTRLDFPEDSIDAHRGSSVSIAILDDTIPEEPEHFELSFFIDSSQSLSGGYAFPSNVARVTIVDNDRGSECSFLETDYTVLESSTKVVIKVLTTDMSLRNSCLLTTEAGTAVAGSDYVEFDEAVEFFGVVTSIEIAIIDDLTEELHETFIITLLSTTPDVIIFGPDVAMVHILNDDIVFFHFSTPLTFVNETNNGTALTIVKRGLADHDVNVTFATINKTADNGATIADFDSIILSLTFRPDDENITVIVPIEDDDVYEFDEEFGASIARLVDGRQRTLSRATVLIASDESVVVGLDYSRYIVKESDGSVNVCVAVNTTAKSIESDISVAIFTQPVTAATSLFQPDNKDFEGYYGGLFFYEFYRKHCIHISIFDNSIYETNETFNVEIIPKHSRGLLIGTSIAEVTILDDDELVIGFVNSIYHVEENAGSATVMFGILNDIETTVEVFVELFFFSGSNDSSFTPQVFVFDSLAPTGFEIAILDDYIPEENEIIQANLRFVGDLPIPRVTLAPAQTTIQIVDDDTIIKCFPRFGCVGIPVEAQMSRCCRHALSPFGVSYTDLEATPGIGQCIRCPVEFGFLQNSIEEQESSSPYKVQIGFLSGSSEFGGVRVTIFFVSGSATENDVVISSKEVNVFEVSSENHAATLELLFKQDAVALEGNETFRLRFTFDREAFGEHAILENTLDGTIIDTDVAAFQLSAPSYSAMEYAPALIVAVEKVSDVFLANPVTFLIHLLTVDEALLREEIVAFEPLNPFAPNRADISDIANSVEHINFPAEERSVFLIRTTLLHFADDFVNEATQYFILKLEARDSTQTIIEQAISVFEIYDDDVLQIEFEEEQYQFFEPDTSSRFNLTLIKKNNRQTEQTFGIDVSFGDPGYGLRPALKQNKNSTIIADYMVDIPETITFGPDESRVTISFMLLPDEVVEGTEGFTASIKSHGDPYPDSDSLLPSSSSILAKTLVVVRDNDYIHVGFERLSYTIKESDSTVAICVQLHNDTDMLNFSVALFYSTERESADGFDFEEIPGTAQQLLIISAEDGLSCINITIIDDILVEETESFTLKLEVARDSDRDSVRFVNQIAEVSIKDNDESVNDNSTVLCFPTMHCGGISEWKNATLFDCCQHGVQPFGLSFIIPEQDGCQLCPVEFGFLEREFTGIERSEEYTANLTFISGNVHLGDGFVVNVTLYPDDGNDVVLTTPQVLITRIYPSSDLQLFPVSFICKKDKVAQEVNEMFTLTIDFNPIFLGATSASTIRDRFTGSIQDSNYVAFQLSQSEYKQDERYGEILVTIDKISKVILANSVSFVILPLTIDEALSRDVISQDMISSFEGNASHDFSPYRADFLDFDNSTISLQFPSEQGLYIPIVDDDINEARHQVFIAYLMVESAVNKDQILLNRATSNCIIIDDDSIQIGFQRSSYEFLEPDDAKASFENITIVKENGRVSEQTFGILITFSEPAPGINVATLQDVGQEIGFDFVVSSPGSDTTALYFYPNQSEITLAVCVVPDDLVEGTEGFRVSIASLGAPFPNFQLPQSVSSATPAFRDTTVKVFDKSDFAILGFQDIVHIVSEDDQEVEICVNVTNPPPSQNLTLNFTLEYTTTRVSASDTDFQEHLRGPSPRFISFRKSVSERKKCFHIAIFQDLIYETTERFLVSLTPIEGTDNIIIEPQNTEVLIHDDDELFLGITESQLQQVEQDVFEFNLLNNQKTEVDIFLVIHIMDDVYQSTANLSTMVCEINAAQPNFSILWENDDIFELDEPVQVQLSFFGPPPPRVNITTENVTITIVDDDSLEFIFTPSEVLAVEGTENFAYFTVALLGIPGNFSFELVLSINDSSSTAAVGIDFDFSSNELKFSSSVNAHDISIGIIDDDLNEFEEHFEVFVSYVSVLDSFGNEIEISNDERSRIVTNKTMTIFIRDKLQFRFAENSYVVNEGVGMITLQVMKEGFATEESSVQFSTEDGSASSVNDTDFVGLSQNFTFTMNENEDTVSIEITDDNMLEGNETFLAILSEVTEAGDVVMIVNVTVIIEDDDATTTMSSLPATDESMQTFPQPMPESQVLGISLGVILGFFALLTLIVVALFIFNLLYKRKHINIKKQISLAGTKRNNEYIRGLKHFTVQTSYMVDIPHSLFIVSSNLKLGATLGQGEFGVVYKGYLKTGISDTIRDTVAVKTLKGFVQKELVRDLLKECGRMYKFDHPNILKLLGVCMDGGPAPFIIMPYMANGSLLAYLKKEREVLMLNPETAKPEDAEVVEKKLLDMCIQVAKGMEYLASKRVIHRDLAARNCMIDINFVIKVADFGLAESMDSSKDYFRQNQEDIIKLPIKWLSLESIHDGVFSEKSDVWSYGVTCWEVFNGGKTPYPGIYPVDLAQHLDRGLRLEKPFNAACTREIYSFMLKCWDGEAHLRPTFAALVEQLSGMLGVMAGYLDISASDHTAETKV